MKHILGIIPARGGSRGIPRKNLKVVAGRPLVVHAIEQAQASKYINSVLVSTEDDEIAGIAQAAGAETMGRLEEYTQDNSIQEVDRLLAWTVQQLEEQGKQVDIVVLLYPTAPLRQVETIDRAIQMVVEQGYDSVLSLYEDTTYLWRRTGDIVEPTNYDPKTRGPRQMEDWNQFAENKAVYVMTRDLLVETGCRLGGRIGHVMMPKWRSIDIDKIDDLRLCESLMERAENEQT